MRRRGIVHDTCWPGLACPGCRRRQWVSDTTLGLAALIVLLSAVLWVVTR